jgi:two-component system sensor histidine kinase VicK
VVLRKERTDLVAIFRTTLEDYQRGGAIIAKQFILSAGTPSIYLAIDSLKFLQVINNLISNAIKFTKDNGRIEVRIEERQPAGNKVPVVRFSVADDGIGIPAKMQPVLFDKFTKARRPGIRGEKSTGLGLSVVKSIVELHGGNIWFESAEGKGTTFYVELPKVQQ